MATSVQDFLKANPRYVGYANTSRRSRPAPPKQKGKGGWFSSIISELGGAGGAAGGAAAGAAAGSVVPVLGTAIGGVIGAAAGGFLGGTAGRGVENKVRDDQNFFGAGGSARSAFGEGALSGALGGVGKGVSAVRGIRAAGGVKNVRAVTDTTRVGKYFTNDDATKAILKGGKRAGRSIADEGFTGGGRLANGASRLESRALGFGRGDKVAGNAATPDGYFKVMKAEGIKTGHPDNVGKQVTAKLSRLGKEMESELSKVNRPLTTAEQSFLKNGFTQEVSGNMALATSAPAQKLAKGYANAFGKMSGVEDIVTQRRNIQNSINFMRNNASATPEKEAVLRIAQTHLNKLSGSISPKLKVLNSRYSGLSDLEEATFNASRGLNSQSRSAMAGVAGTLKAGDAATALKAAIGSKGRALSDVRASVPMQDTKNIAKGAAARGLANAMFFPSEEEAIEDPNAPQDIGGVGTLTSDALYGLEAGGEQPAVEGAPQTQYGLEQALDEAYGLLGPNESPSSYLSYAKELMNQRKSSGGSGLNVTKPTQEDYTNAVTGTQALQQLNGLISSDPGILQRTRTPGRGLNVLGIGSEIQKRTGTAEFDTLGFQAVENLLRIQTGAAAPEQEVRRYMNKYLPQPSDSEETKNLKIERMNAFFTSVLQQAEGGQTQAPYYGQQGAYQ